MLPKDDTFFDIHMHAFNLGHPNFYAFLKRFNLVPEALLDVGFKVVIGFSIILGIIFGIIFGLVFHFWKLPLLSSIGVSIGVFVILIVIIYRFPPLRRWLTSLISNMRKKLSNMLSIFENDIGSFFLITEDCLREDKNPLLKNKDLTIGTRKYQRIVLTPLMMDFGYKGKKKKKDESPEYHYDRPAEKPIVEQVTDVFNAVEKYRRYTSPAVEDDRYKKFPFLVPDTERVFEIYPFLGINTQHYELLEIRQMLEKYFVKPDSRGRKYEGLREDLFENLGKFEGKIDNIPSNYFAGVKVYPPLGFDPWPADKPEREKVEYLYTFCTEHRIPITSHGGGGGFVAIDNEHILKEYTSISKWESVLDQKFYSTLKLNIAHFPVEFESQRVLTRPEYKIENQRLKIMIRLILEKDNVYTDFSCRAWNNEYFRCLKKVLDSLSKDKRNKLKSRILFGSDYAVNLGAVESYNQYVDVFSRTEHLTPDEKHAFCCLNPQSFLFSSGRE